MSIMSNTMQPSTCCLLPCWNTTTSKLGQKLIPYVIYSEILKEIFPVIDVWICNI